MFLGRSDNQGPSSPVREGEQMTYCAAMIHTLQGIVQSKGAPAQREHCIALRCLLRYLGEVPDDSVQPTL